MAVDDGVEERAVDDGVAFTALEVTVALVADCWIVDEEPRGLPVAAGVAAIGLGAAGAAGAAAAVVVAAAAAAVVAGAAFWAVPCCDDAATESPDGVLARRPLLIATVSFVITFAGALPSRLERFAAATRGESAATRGTAVSNANTAKTGRTRMTGLRATSIL